MHTRCNNKYILMHRSNTPFSSIDHTRNNKKTKNKQATNKHLKNRKRNKTRNNNYIHQKHNTKTMNANKQIKKTTFALNIDFIVSYIFTLLLLFLSRLWFDCALVCIFEFGVFSCRCVFELLGSCFSVCFR